jgi:hypothetical protein
VLCKHEVVGSIPSGSTRTPIRKVDEFRRQAIGSAGKLSDIVKRRFDRYVPILCRIDRSVLHCGRA